jgi:hypothetical protein
MRAPLPGCAAGYIRHVSTPARRASDSDRERTADHLRSAAADGRLDATELEERLDDAYRAKTLEELAPLTADLPEAQPSAERESSLWGRRHVRERLAGFLTANLVCIAVWAATGADGSFWPKWVLLGTGIALVSTVIRTAMGVEDEERVLPSGPGDPDTRRRSS